MYYQKIIAKLYLQRRCLKLTTFVCSLVLIIFFLILKLSFNNTYQNIIQEDSVLENAQAITYLLASIFSFLVMATFARSRRYLHTLLFLTFTLAFIFICLEEVSWGQRILNLPTFGYFKTHNKQNELTVHNLNQIHQRMHKVYILVGLLGSFGWLILHKRIRPENRVRMSYFIPDWYLMFYFLPVFAIYSYFQVVDLVADHWTRLDFLRIGHFVVWRDQEPAELLLSFGFLLFAMRNKLRQVLDVMDVTSINSQT